MITEMSRKISILQLTGITLLDCNKYKIIKIRCLSISFHIWLIFAFIVNMTATKMRWETSDFTMALSYAFANSLCLAIFITLWLKKRQILKLKEIMENISNNNASKPFAVLKVIQIFNLCLFIFYPIVFFNLDFVYTQDIIAGLFLVIDISSFIFIQVTLPLSITVVYASCCCWCSTQLKLIASQIKSTPAFLRGKKIFKILEYYQFILRIATSVEKAFSTVTLISLVSYLVIIFTYMGNLIRGHYLENFTSRFHMSFHLIFDICGMTALIAYPSEIPTIIERIKLKLCIIEEKLSLKSYKNVSCATKSLIETFSKRDVFAFSACNMVHFKRSVIITTYGTLISYGLLLLQLK